MQVGKSTVIRGLERKRAYRLGATAQYLLTRCSLRLFQNVTGVSHENELCVFIHMMNTMHLLKRMVQTRSHQYFSVKAQTVNISGFTDRVSHILLFLQSFKHMKTILSSWFWKSQVWPVDCSLQPPTQMYMHYPHPSVILINYAFPSHCPFIAPTP